MPQLPRTYGTRLISKPTAKQHRVSRRVLTDVDADTPPSWLYLSVAASGTHSGRYTQEHSQRMARPSVDLKRHMDSQNTLTPPARHTWRAIPSISSLGQLSGSTLHHKPNTQARAASSQRPLRATEVSSEAKVADRHQTAIKSWRSFDRKSPFSRRGSHWPSLCIWPESCMRLTE